MSINRNTDPARESFRQRRISDAIRESVTDCGEGEARAAIEAVIARGAPANDREDLVFAALRVAAMDLRVRAAVNNAAHVLLTEAEMNGDTDALRRGYGTDYEATEGQDDASATA